MPEAAYYGAGQFRHADMYHPESRPARVLQGRPDNASNRAPTKRVFKAPQMAYKNSSDEGASEEEDNKIYESLEQLNYRKSKEMARRRAKIARVQNQKTGHPLFDSLREERALKENVSTAKSKKFDTKLSPKNVSNSQLPPGSNRKAIPHSQSLGNMKNYGNYANNPKIVVHESQPQESSRKHSAHFLSLQKINSDKQARNYRKVSEGYLSRTLPTPLALTKKNLAKSEQNLSFLHQNSHPMMVGGRRPFMMMNHHGHPAMNQWPPHHGHHYPTRVPRHAPQVDSSDSDSDWIIPRPKFSTQKSRNRSSDESDYSGPLNR